VADDCNQPAVGVAREGIYGLQFGIAPWFPDLVARYDLTPPPGIQPN
jgi:hypothetical protein